MKKKIPVEELLRRRNRRISSLKGELVCWKLAFEDQQGRIQVLKEEISDLKEDSRTHWRRH